MPERAHLVGRAPQNPSLEDRVRELELWAVAAHEQIKRNQERAEALEPVVETLERAALAQAAVADANMRRQAITLGRFEIPAKTISLMVGAASLAAFAARLRS